MKKSIIVVSFVFLLVGAFAFKAHADYTTGDLFQIIQKVVSKFDLAVAELKDRMQGHMVHVTLHDGECQTGRNDIVVGWCPDDTRSNFSITDANFKNGNSVITAQASSPVDAGVVKIDNCTFRAVTGVGTESPLIRLVCEFAPNNGSTLSYVIVNH